LSSAFQSKNSQSLSLKEKTQAGVELIGADSLKSDLEMLMLLFKTMKAVKVEEPLIDIGHADLINEIFADLHLNEKQKIELRKLLAAKNRVGVKNYLKKVNLSKDVEQVLLRLPVLFGSPKKVISELETMPLSEETIEVLKTLGELFNKLEDFDLLKYITFDPMLISRHGYYTGLIFKGYAEGYNNLLAGGGRYDNLTEKFGVEEAAVGFALEIENLLDYLNKTENFTEDEERRFLLSYNNKSDFMLIEELAEDLRNAGYTAETALKVEQEYLEFQQIDYHVQLFENKLILTQNTGAEAEIERKEKIALEYLILNKIEEWE